MISPIKLQSIITYYNKYLFIFYDALTQSPNIMFIHQIPALYFSFVISEYKHAVITPSSSVISKCSVLMRSHTTCPK
jgi:hypothetical protein